MREAIAGFSGDYFYKGLLQTAAHLSNTGTHLSFIDTAGSGYNEIQGSNGMSLQNEGELKIAQKLLETELPTICCCIYFTLFRAGRGSKGCVTKTNAWRAPVTYC